MREKMEHKVERELTRKVKLLRGNLTQCHFFHHKSHLNWPGIEPGPLGREAVTNLLSCGTAFMIPYRENYTTCKHHKCTVQHVTWYYFKDVWKSYQLEISFSVILLILSMSCACRHHFTEAIKYSGSLIQCVGLLYVEKHWYFGFCHARHIFPIRNFQLLLSAC